MRTVRWLLFCLLVVAMFGLPDQIQAAKGGNGGGGGKGSAPSQSQGSSHRQGGQYQSSPNFTPQTSAPGQAKKSAQPAPRSQPAGQSQPVAYSQPTAKSQSGNPNAGCNQTPYPATGPGANHSGPYDDTCTGAPSQNGNGGGKAVGRPCAGCVGNADEKNPAGQYPGPSDRNRGYECDGNHGIARTNPAHTGCRTSPPPPPCQHDCEPPCKHGCEPPCKHDCEPPCRHDCEPPCRHDCEPPHPCHFNCNGGGRGGGFFPNRFFSPGPSSFRGPVPQVIRPLVLQPVAAAPGVGGGTLPVTGPSIDWVLAAVASFLSYAWQKRRALRQP